MQYQPQQPYQNGQPYDGQPQQPPVQQAPAAQYPIRQAPVQQYPAQQYPQPHFFQPPLSPEEYRAENYRRSLRRTVNGLGGLMLIFFGLEFVLGTITILIPYLTGRNISEISDESSPLFLLENGAFSMIIFFVSALIYCFIKKVSFAEIFPFDKIGAGYLTKLCVIGLCFSLMSNYVVDMVNNTFGLFGIENSGGEINTGSEPNVLLYFLTVAILPAFVEEFAFRGVIMGVLRPYSSGLAILVSSAAFALMHGNFVQLPFTFCCGVVFAYIDIKTNSLLPSIIIHFLNNGLSVLADILTSYGILTEGQANLGYGAIFAVTGILSFIFLKGIIQKKDNSYFALKNGDDVIPYKTKVRTAVTSPTLITFTAVMLSYCVLELFLV